MRTFAKSSALTRALAVVLIGALAASCGSVGELGPEKRRDPMAMSDAEESWAKAWVDGAVFGANPVIEVTCLSQGWGAMRRGESINDGPLCLGGRKFESGLGSHADGDVRVRTAKPMKRFHAWAGVDDNDRTRSSEAARMAFSVESGGRTLWSCPPRGAADGAVEVSVDLEGATEFHLVVKSPDGRIRFAHADWVEPTVTFDDGTNADLTKRDSTLGTQSRPPFSFRYAGRPSDELLVAWSSTTATEIDAAGVKHHKRTWRDAATGLECIFECEQFPDFPAARWVIRFRNAGAADTPILEDVQALDASWRSSSKTVLGCAKGSRAAIDDFLYISKPLPQVEFDDGWFSVDFACNGERTSANWMPFFNLRDDRAGVMLGLGWTGSWAAHFAQNVNRDVHVRAGMEKAHLVLHPGEEIRTPAALALFYEGDALRGHNLLRRFMLRHNTPQEDGKPITAPLAFGSWGGQLTSEQLEQIARAPAAGLQFDVFWVDAGWFGDAGGRFIPESTGHWYTQAGRWNIDRSIHPDGFLEVSKAARAAGMPMMLWVEPERAVWGSLITREHPDWFLGEKKDGRSVLLDLGNPAARAWATDLVSTLVKDLDLAWYRQDFNMNCANLWQANDAPDRQGMTEIRHVEGLYAFWDELRRRHPRLKIDDCASGGRRLDFEMLRRSIPLWRSDYQCGGSADPIGGQVHTMGLNYWAPLHGTSAGAGPFDTYAFRSNLSAAMQWWVVPEAVTDPKARDWYRAMIAQYRRARPFYYGDYYPLTPISTDAAAWAGYQMHREDLGAGMVLIFRRSQSPYTAATLKLGGLDPARSYEIEDADTGAMLLRTGRQLMDGVSWAIDTPRSSRMIFYRAAGEVLPP